MAKFAKGLYGPKGVKTLEREVEVLQKDIDDLVIQLNEKKTLLKKVNGELKTSKAAFNLDNPKTEEPVEEIDDEPVEEIDEEPVEEPVNVASKAIGFLHKLAGSDKK